MRAVIYARYSSDLQRGASIEDQVRLCRERAAAEGWTIVEHYADRAVSGASKLRAEYQRLLQDARSGRFDIVIAEALDRLSRDQEDVAGLFKQLRFAGVRLVTLAEGEISELHVGLKGTMNALFLKDLADKTRRGLRGRIEQGRSAGGRCFGYRVKRDLDERGEPIRGARVIDPDEAAVVRQIFERFDKGASPRAIAKALNAEAVPGPNGRPWQDTTIRGHGERGTGILRNELYAGRLVWNRQSYVKDPSTGKRVSKPNPRSAWIVEEVPELRIVDEDLFQRVAARLGDIAQSPAARAIREARPWEKRRPKHMLTGLIRCGLCGHALSAIGRDYLGCSRAQRAGLCSNTTRIRRGVIEDVVLEALRHNLMQPDLVAEFIREVHAELNRSRGDAAAERRRHEKRLAEIERQLDGLITAIAEGLRASGLQTRLDALEAEKATLTAKLSGPAPSPVRLHPNLADLYREKVGALRAALEREDTRDEAFEILRGLIDKVVLHPRPQGEGFEIELVGDIAAMVEVAMAGSNGNALRGDRRALGEGDVRSVKVVAGTRNHRQLTLVCAV
jgi:site-specific DNA recombinase